MRRPANRPIFVILAPFLAALLSGCAPTPNDLDRRVGLEARSGFEAHFGGLFHNLDAQDRVQRIGDKLVGSVQGLPRLNWEFRVLNAEQMNSFALPGGLIYITRGLLVHLHDDAEIAAVLAHQIAHVADRDSIRNLDQWQNIPGEMEQTAVPRNEQKKLNQSAVAENLPLLSYGDAQEQSANLAALDYLYQAGYPPRALVQMLNKIKSSSPPADYLSTHPLPMNEIPALESVIATRYPTSIGNSNSDQRNGRTNPPE